MLYIYLNVFCTDELTGHRCVPFSFSLLPYLLVTIHFAHFLQPTCSPFNIMSFLHLFPLHSDSPLGHPRADFLFSLFVSAIYPNSFHSSIHLLIICPEKQNKTWSEWISERNNRRRVGCHSPVMSHTQMVDGVKRREGRGQRCVCNYSLRKYDRDLPKVLFFILLSKAEEHPVYYSRRH